MVRKVFACTHAQGAELEEPQRGWFGFECSLVLWYMITSKKPKMLQFFAKLFPSVIASVDNRKFLKATRMETLQKKILNCRTQ